MSIVLDKWQQDVLDYKGDLLLCTGRRVGKTYILARKAVDRMATTKNCPIVIVSLTEDQAMIIMSMALNYAQEAYPKLIGKGKNKPTLKSLFINGNKMVVRPVGNTGDGARGFEGGVLIVDEASRMPKMFWIAAKPILLTTNGEVWMGSTPFGKQGYFWERFHESHDLNLPDARFKTFYISSEEVMLNRPISESWTEAQRNGAIRILKREKEEMTKLEYGQEYLGLFLEELRQFFPDELIRKCMKRKRDGVVKGGTLGVDIARMGEDLSTFEIFVKIGDRVIQKENQITKRTYLNDTTKHIIGLNQVWNFDKILIDDEGIGVGVFDYLMDFEDTKRKTVSVNNSKRLVDYKKKKEEKIFKEVLYNHLLGLMERDKIELLDDEDIFQSFKSVQSEYEEDSYGRLHFKIFGTNTHIVEGVTRAVWGLKNKSLNIWISSIRV